MAPQNEEYEDIIRVIEGADNSKKLCLIRIYKEAGDQPRPVIELDRPDQQYFTYDILREFSGIPEAHEYAEKNDVFDVEY